MPTRPIPHSEANPHFCSHFRVRPIKYALAHHIIRRTVVVGTARGQSAVKQRTATISRNNERALRRTPRMSPLLLAASLATLVHLAVCLRANRSPAIEDASMRNVTAMRGNTVEFRCRVENAEKHAVAFFRDEVPPKLIAYDESVFRRTDKYELLARVNKNEWILRIRDVQEGDAGGYICQLNSNPVITRTGHLELRIPPSISRSSTPAAVEVREGHNVTLSCRANGNPPPTIVWRRADRQIIRYNGIDGYGDSVHKGADLTLSRVSRKHMSEYLCVASNGIPPDESWSIKLHVLFEPIVVPQSLVAEAPLNALVVRLACTVEAWPRPNVVWLFEGQPLHDSNKYSTEQFVSERYKSVHVLEIRSVRREQYGAYRCLASNDYGSHFGEIRLIEAPPVDDRSLVASLSEGSGANPDDEAGEEEALDGWRWLPRTSTSPSIWLRKQQSDTELRRSVSRGLKRPPDNEEPGRLPSLIQRNGASSQCPRLGAVLMSLCFWFWLLHGSSHSAHSPPVPFHPMFSRKS